MAKKSNGKAWSSRQTVTDYYKILQNGDAAWPAVGAVFAFWYWGDQTLLCERSGIVTTKGEIDRWVTSGLIERVNKDGSPWKDLSKKRVPESAPA